MKNPMERPTTRGRAEAAEAFAETGRKEPTDINVLRAAAHILRKLRTYAMMDAVRPYQTQSIFREIGADPIVGADAVRYLVSEKVLEESGDQILLDIIRR